MIFSDTAFVMVAGGSGTRYGGKNKLLEPLAGIPAVIYPVLRLGRCFPADLRIMAIPAGTQEMFAELLQKFAPQVPFRLVEGGAVRSLSVQNALQAVPGGIRYVAVHDAARPLASEELLREVLDAARTTGGAVPGHPVADTLKRAGETMLVAETVSRERLFAVSTPQCFDLAKLRDAYRKNPESRTDDAGTMEAAGYPVCIVPEKKENPKLTYPGDLLRLEHLLEEEKNASMQGTGF